MGHSLRPATLQRIFRSNWHFGMESWMSLDETIIQHVSLDIQRRVLPELVPRDEKERKEFYRILGRLINDAWDKSWRNMMHEEARRERELRKKYIRPPKVSSSQGHITDSHKLTQVARTGWPDCRNSVGGWGTPQTKRPRYQMGRPRAGRAQEERFQTRRLQAASTQAKRSQRRQTKRGRERALSGPGNTGVDITKGCLGSLWVVGQIWGYRYSVHLI